MTVTKPQLDKILNETVSEVLAVLDIDLYLDKKKACRFLSISLSFLEKLMPEVPHFKLGCGTAIGDWYDAAPSMDRVKSFGGQQENCTFQIW